MDWTFYLIGSIALFAIMVAILGVRYYLSERFDKLEKIERMEEEARTTAESNSGL